jgi:hypothetical protein
MFNEDQEIKATLDGIESCLQGEGNMRLDRAAAAIILAAFAADVRRAAHESA